MVVVHPAFDPSTKTWFTLDGIEAASLCELKQKIPGVKIVGYYPHGAPSTKWPSLSDSQNNECRATMRSNYRGPKRQLEAAKTQARLAQAVSEQVKGKPQHAEGSKTTDGPLRKQLEKLTTDLVNSGQILPLSSPLVLKKLKPEKKQLSSVQSRHTLKHRPRQQEKQPETTWEVRPKVSWSKKDDEILKSLARKGDSASVIGMVLKVTRNAVIGRAHRIGVTLGRTRYAGQP
jgi:hypothetical protein